jgi:hypothetical protein
MNAVSLSLEREREIQREMTGAVVYGITSQAQFVFFGLKG